MAGKTLAGEGGKEEARHFPSSELCRMGLGSKPVKGPRDKRERMKGLRPQRHRAGWGQLLEFQESADSEIWFSFRKRIIDKYCGGWYSSSNYVPVTPLGGGGRDASCMYPICHVLGCVSAEFVAVLRITDI